VRRNAAGLGAGGVEVGEFAEPEVRESFQSSSFQGRCEPKDSFIASRNLRIWAMASSWVFSG
jgi:hypothetical protein